MKDKEKQTNRTDNFEELSETVSIPNKEKTISISKFENIKLTIPFKKEIEEMAEVLDDYASTYISNAFDLQEWRNFAETLYNADYRKASEVAREIFEKIEKLTASVYNDFMFNREGVGMNAHYVVQFSDELDIAIAELKKKYTEVGNGKQGNN